MVRTIDREHFRDTIRDRSQFEENATAKISDARTHESVVTDQNITTSHNISSARTITEKLSEHKHDKAVSATPEHGMTGEYRTETEIHGLVDPEKPQVTPQTVQTANAPVQPASPLITERETKFTGEKQRSKPKENGTVSEKYSSALRNDRAEPEQRMQSSTYKGGQMRYVSESGGNTGTGTGKYSATGGGAQTPAALERLKTYRGSTGTVVASNSATGKVKTAETQAKPGKGQPKGKTDKYGNIIPSRISSKAKGKEETKAKNISKAKNMQKDALEKKVTGTKSASGKFQKKISTDKTKRNKSKVKTAAVQAVNYKLGESQGQEQTQNASVEATRAGAGAAYAVYSKFNRRRNNAMAQKFLHKSKAYKTSKGANEAVNRMTGKYAGKASKSLSKAQDAQKKAQAAKRALQARQAKKFRQAKEKEKKAAHAFQEVKQTAVKVAKKIAEFARAHATVTITVALFLITFIAVSAALGSCAMALTSGSSTYVSGMSGALDPAMTDCDSYLTEKEMKLQEKIDNIQEDYPDYDEYIFDCDEIGHDSIKLMAFLSATYDSYDLEKVKGTLDQIFDEMYDLKIEPKVEQRLKEVFNPETGEYEEKMVDVDVLYITLRKKAWDDVVSGKFPDDSAKERYEIYDDTEGAHQAFYNPFTIDWKTKITSKFGWRIHPTLGYEKFHNGIDIGMPAGTEIHACSTGKVITATYSNTAGNYVVVQDETGYTTHYMHMTSYNVSVGQVVKHGDIIGKVGSTGRSTGPHLHLGIKDASGEWLNPEFLVSNYTGGAH